MTQTKEQKQKAEKCKTMTEEDWFGCVKSEQADRHDLNLAEYSDYYALYHYAEKGMLKKVKELVRSENKRILLEENNKILHKFYVNIDKLSVEDFFRFVSEKKPKDLFEIFKINSDYFFWYLKYDQFERKKIKNKVASYCDLDVKQIDNYSCEDFNKILSNFPSKDMPTIKLISGTLYDKINRLTKDKKMGLGLETSGYFSEGDFSELSNTDLKELVLREKKTFSEFKIDASFCRRLSKNRPFALMLILDEYKDSVVEAELFEFNKIFKATKNVVDNTLSLIEEYKKTIKASFVDYASSKKILMKKGLVLRPEFSNFIRKACIYNEGDLKAQNAWYIRREILKDLIYEMQITYQDVMDIPLLFEIIKGKFLLSEINIPSDEIDDIRLWKVA